MNIEAVLIFGLFANNPCFKPSVASPERNPRAAA